MLTKRQSQLCDASVVFTVLGSLIYQEPQPEQLAELVHDDFFAELPMAASTSQAEAGLRELRRWAKRAAEQPLDEVAQELSCEWLRLLIGFGEPAAPPWAAYYFEHDPRIFGQKTLDVRNWYARHDLQIEHKYKEPDDHLGLMLLFLARLMSKESKHLSLDENLKAADLAIEQLAFIEENLLPWVGHWQKLVIDSTKISFYRGLSQLICGCLQAYSTALKEEVRDGR